MLSQRHMSSRALDGPSDEPAQRELPESVLEATKAAVVAVGVRRTTLTDVARRAGVSRMTVYRMVPDVETLVLEVLSREFGAVVAQAERATARRRTGRARLVGAVVEIVRRLPDEPLFMRILDVDPERLLPFVTDRLGSTQRIALARVRRMLTDGHADGSIRRADPDVQAMTLLLATTPFVLSARLFDASPGRESVLRELAAVLDRGLAP